MGMREVFIFVFLFFFCDIFLVIIMFIYCFKIFIVGCNMVGVCLLWCVIGMKDDDFLKLIIVVVNLFM